MERDPPQPGAVEQLSELPLDAARVECRADIRGEHQPRLMPSLAGKAPVELLACAVPTHGGRHHFRHA